MRDTIVSMPIHLIYVLTIIWSIYYFIFSETPVVLEKYIWTLYMNTQSHWLFLFYLYKKHEQNRHYFMCDMIFLMFKN